MKNRNMAAIRQGFPELYARMIEIENKSGQDAYVAETEKLPTKTGEMSLCATLRSGQKIRLNSAFDPECEAAFWYEGQIMGEAENIFVFGLGNGVFFKEILKNWDHKGRILVYEPSIRIFLYALEHFDLTDCFLTKGVRLIVEDLNEDLFSAVMEEMLTFENYKKHTFLFLPGMQTWFPESRKKLLQHYADDGVAWIESFRNTERWLIHISPYNQLHNLQFLEKSTIVPYLKPVCEKDVPVILIGSGPSLRDEIEVLREAKDKAFLFAVDSALPFLLKENVIPDAYMCVEADKPMEFFAEERTRDIPAFIKMESTHKMLDRHRAEKIFGYDIGFAEQIYKDYNIPESQFRYGANVATSLFAICAEIGVRTVILTGQDMCYSDEGISHVEDRNQGFKEKQVYLCENNEGKIVQSRWDWSRFLKWYESAIHTCHFDHVINSCLRGAKIKGAEVMPLKEALARYGRTHTSFQKLLAGAKRALSQSKPLDLNALYHTCKQELEEMSELIRKDPHDVRRKDYRMYRLLEKYEIADMEDCFEESQQKGLDKLVEYVDRCILECAKQENETGV